MLRGVCLRDKVLWGTLLGLSGGAAKRQARSVAEGMAEAQQVRYRLCLILNNWRSIVPRVATTCGIRWILDALNAVPRSIAPR